jgi:NADH-quinone oxidoreductase subunit L
MFMTFWGEYRGHAHPHESPPVMWVPLAVLAALSILGGILFNVPEILAPIFPVAELGHNILLEVIGSAAGLAGIAIAWFVYLGRPGLAGRIAERLGALYQLVYNKYFVDEFYDATVVKPVIEGSRTLLWRGFDVAVIDGAVNGVGALSRNIGLALRRVQSGNIRSYAVWVLVGAVLVVFGAGVMGGGQ